MADQVKVRVVLVPKIEPNEMAMDSLMVCIQTALLSGFHVVFEKLRDGAYGAYNAGAATSHFINSDATHMFWAADDMLYPPDMLIKLVNDDVDIVTTIYRKRNFFRCEPANYSEDAEEFIRCYREGGVYETKYAAGHTMMIKRKVIEKMIKDYPELEYVDHDTQETRWALFMDMVRDKRLWLSDWAFSVRARESGFKIWTDFGCRCKHWAGGFIGFEEVLDANQQQQGTEQGQGVGSGS